MMSDSLRASVHSATRERARPLLCPYRSTQTNSVVLMERSQGLPKLLQAQIGLVVGIIRSILRWIPTGKKNPFRNSGLSSLKGL